MKYVNEWKNKTIWRGEKCRDSRGRSELQQNFYVYSSLFFLRCQLLWPIPVAERSKAWVSTISLAGIAGLNPAGGAWMSSSWTCCVLSGRGPCAGLITRPEESYRLWCV